MRHRFKYPLLGEENRFVLFDMKSTLGLTRSAFLTLDKIGSVAVLFMCSIHPA